MNVTRRRALLTLVVFAGVLSIGPFIAPAPDVVTAAPPAGSGRVALGAAPVSTADIVGGERKDATGVPEPGRVGARLLAVALFTVALGLAAGVATRPVERRPLRLRPVVALLPDRRGPPTVAV